MTKKLSLAIKNDCDLLFFSNIAMDLSKYSMDELQQIHVLHNLYDSFPADLELLKKLYPEILAEIGLFNKKFWEQFDIRMIDPYKNDIFNYTTISVYHEFPDFSKSYTYNEIFNTFSSITQIDHMFNSSRNTGNKTYFLTERSFGNQNNYTFGNIIEANTLKYMKFPKYIYENPAENDFVLYCVIDYQHTLIRVREKIIQCDN